MPIYEYQCVKCGQFEITQKITDRPLGRCPTCKGKVKKLISNTSFQLKGTGWYATDYARKDQGAKEKTAGADGKGNGKAADTPAPSDKSTPEKKSSTTTTASESASTS
jgi:putative FmdB family regulatory protein